MREIYEIRRSRKIYFEKYISHIKKDVYEAELDCILVEQILGGAITDSFHSKYTVQELYVIQRNNFANFEKYIFFSFEIYI